MILFAGLLLSTILLSFLLLMQDLTLLGLHILSCSSKEVGIVLHEAFIEGED